MKIFREYSIKNSPPPYDRDILHGVSPGIRFNNKNTRPIKKFDNGIVLSGKTATLTAPESITKALPYPAFAPFARSPHFANVAD